MTAFLFQFLPIIFHNNTFERLFNEKRYNLEFIMYYVA
jgi:hypothetical protein